jgi:hypothetical protein
MRNSTGKYADTVLKPLLSNKSYSANSIAEFEQIHYCFATHYLVHLSNRSYSAVAYQNLNKCYFLWFKIDNTYWSILQKYGKISWMI